MESNTFIIAEFNDGLQLIPATWYNADNSSSIWPSHFKTKLRINKAIMTREIPQEKSDWEVLPIKKVFGTANSYEEGITKLFRAEDTSNIDDTDNLSANELREKEKKKRRVRAKRTISSSEDDLSPSEDIKNNIRQDKILPNLPRKEAFISHKKQLLSTKPVQNTRNILRENTCFSATNSNDPNNNIKNSSYNINVENSAANTNNEHFDFYDFKKHILWKLNKILYKSDNMENKLDMQEKQQSSNQFYIQEINTLLPICTISDLESFEEQLKEKKFQDDVLNFLKLIGENTPYIMIRNIFKKAISDNVAKHFSWAGRKSKQSFKDLRFSKIIKQVVHMAHKDITDTDIADYASKWLAQANVRLIREKVEDDLEKEKENIK